MRAAIKTIFEAVFLGMLLLKCEGTVRRQKLYIGDAGELTEMVIDVASRFRQQMEVSSLE